MEYLRKKSESAGFSGRAGRWLQPGRWRGFLHQMAVKKIDGDLSSRGVARWGKGSIFTTGKSSIRQKRGATIPLSSDSQPFDTALRATSGQAVNLQEATSGPGIRVAEYCLVIYQWHPLLWPLGDRQRSEVMP